MRFFSKLFGFRSNAAEGTSPTVPGSANAGASENSETQQLVATALAVVEGHVRVGPEGFVVEGAGSDGPVMAAARALERAVALSPSGPRLHYANCSALAIAAQGAAARAEMEALSRAHPDFQLAIWALARWETWKSLFALPPWAPSIQQVNVRLSKALTSCALLPTRDGILPRATFFFRDREGTFQDLGALRAARIDITTVVDQQSAVTPVVGVYARVWDDPKNSLNLEAHGLPASGERSTHEYLSDQTDIDFVVVDQTDRILLNRRLLMPNRMRSAHQDLTKLLHSIQSRTFRPEEIRAAIQSHQKRFEAATVAY